MVSDLERELHEYVQTRLTCLSPDLSMGSYRDPGRMYSAADRPITARVPRGTS